MRQCADALQHDDMVFSARRRAPLGVFSALHGAGCRYTHLRAKAMVERIWWSGARSFEPTRQDTKRCRRHFDNHVLPTRIITAIIPTSFFGSCTHPELYRRLVATAFSLTDSLLVPLIEFTGSAMRFLLRSLVCVWRRPTSTRAVSASIRRAKGRQW